MITLGSSVGTIGVTRPPPRKQPAPWIVKTPLGTWTQLRRAHVGAGEFSLAPEGAEPRFLTLPGTDPQLHSSGPPPHAAY